jgi:hypothetical protein
VHIDWTSLLAVAVVAAAAALIVVLLVAFALVGLSARVELPAGRPGGGDATGTRSGLGTASAMLCLFAAALIVGYGLYLIIA